MGGEYKRDRLTVSLGDACRQGIQEAGLCGHHRESCTRCKREHDWRRSTILFVDANMRAGGDGLDGHVYERRCIDGERARDRS